MIQLDMEMPKNCAECRFRNPDYGFCYADYDGNVIHDSNFRPDWCPLRNVKKEKAKHATNPAAAGCVMDLPFPVCANCPELKPELLDDKLYADELVVMHDLRVVCTNAGICLNLIKMKEQEVMRNGQSQPDADADQL